MRISEDRSDTTRAGRRPTPVVAALLLAIPLLSAVPAPAVLAAGGEDADEAQEQERASAEEEQVRVFTNDDLKKYRLRARETAREGDVLKVNTRPKAPAAPPPGALTAEEKARRKAELEARIQQAEERLAAIASRRASLRNPFLPRPELTEEERIEVAGKDAKERLAILEAEEADLRARISQAREDLAALAKTPTAPAPAGEERPDRPAAPGANPGS